jgi:acyl-CoA-dependent ceramide synthase
LFSLVAAYKLNPALQPTIIQFFKISYYNAETGQYKKGFADMCIVAFWIMAITGLRVATMDYFFIPFASANGILSRKGRIRFAEQGWMVAYYSISFGVGLVRISLLRIC